MATVIRLSRRGRRNRPHYRVGVYDRRTRRDGPPIEHLGHYDPLIEDDEKKVEVDIWHWQDPLLQPNQLLQVQRERGRTWLAVAHLAFPCPPGPAGCRGVYVAELREQDGSRKREQA